MRTIIIPNKLNHKPQAHARVVSHSQTAIFFYIKEKKAVWLRETDARVCKENKEEQNKKQLLVKIFCG